MENSDTNSNNVLNANANENSIQELIRAFTGLMRQDKTGS